MLAGIMVGLIVAVPGAAYGDPAVVRSFDGPELSWQLIDARPGVRLVAHGCIGSDAREGSGSERVVVVAPAGESVHLACSIGRVAVLDELQVRMWIKSNRPGVQLASRVVLPRSTDPVTGVPKTALVQGVRYDDAGRWQQLTFSDVPKLLANEVRVMRATPSSNIDPREAYVDAIVLMVPGGQGGTVVWTDAMEVEGIVISPLADQRLTVAHPAGDHPRDRATAGYGWRQDTASRAGDPSSRAARVELRGTTLTVAGHPFLPQAIHWNGEPMAFLAARGFNAVCTEVLPTDDLASEAAQAGIWFICTPPRPEELTANGIGVAPDRILGWHLGSPNSPSELDYFRRWAELVRQHDPPPSRPILIAPQSDWLPLSKAADVLIASHPASSSLTAGDFAKWLQGLPLLARPGTPFWVNIPTQPGQRAREQILTLSNQLTARPVPSVAVDERQVETLVRTAGVHACRGFLFESASRLDAPDEASKRRALLLEAVNRQLQLIEPWLTRGTNVGQATAVDGTTTATVLQVERARLLIPTSANTRPAAGTTSAAKSIASTASAGPTFLVPGVPETNEAFLLAKAYLRPLASKRVAGGTRIALGSEQDLVLLSDDFTVIANYRQRVAQSGRRATQLQRDLAAAHTKLLADASRQLESLGLEGSALQRAVDLANAEIARCNSLLASRNVEAAYDRAASARQILADAVAELRQSTLAASTLRSGPFNPSGDLLVQQAEFQTAIESLSPGENLLSGGDFEDLGQLMRHGWRHVNDAMAGVACSAELSAQNPHAGRYCLQLSAADVAGEVAPQIIGRPLVWITSPSLHVPAGQTLEISGWVRLQEPIKGNVDGLQIIDSLGGAELSLRVTESPGWQPFRMIRGVPESTEMTVAFALTGLGTACIDGVMIRPLSNPTVRRLPSVADDEGPAFPNSARRVGPLFEPSDRR